MAEESPKKQKTNQSNLDETANTEEEDDELLFFKEEKFVPLRKEGLSLYFLLFSPQDWSTHTFSTFF
jgi:hypothetical protein